MEKNILTAVVKQYAADKYGISLDTIKSFDISLVIMSDTAPDSLPDITGIGFSIEEAFEDLISEEAFITVAFEDSGSLKHYELCWNAYKENGCDILDGYFRITPYFAYYCNAYIKGKVKLSDVFAYGLKDYRFSEGTASSCIPVHILANANIEILEEVK